MKSTHNWIIAAAGCLLFGCGKDSNTGGTTGNATDVFKKNMLVNYADTLIQPAYSDLQSKIALLETAADAFLAAPSAVTQQALKLPFKNAYVSFEGISALYFGPGAAQQLNNTVNTFPTAINKIETGIQSGNYNLAQVIASDSIQGFPALDYLFFSSNAVQQFNGTTATNRKKYVKDIFARMKLLLTNTQNQWTNGYREVFVSNLQTNVGSSIGSLVNQFAFEMDALKGPRIGWPFGKQSNGIVFADKCEGYFSAYTKDLSIANLSALKKYYTGGNGNGIDDYLNLLGKQQLNSDVLAQFNLALNALNAIPDPMSAAFTNNAAVVETAYRETQKLLTLIKTDVASATAVQITYMDNDGD
ncbi:imelysin family protein [Chitinophaga sp. sic0106]|uniref:imelysin family protein n=1 Tax=Chitinophaga sp. sic0106 TaxID=2854785 RepID=UPI001C47FFEF|nr:imelysin family protein [Chitinophaga sp. sic0106]MBV7530878.1 imelysin family protein [Chitinophaga sp. sic0106]